MNRLGAGEWIATYPGRELIGYHVTKMFSGQTSLDSIIGNLNTANQTKLKEAYNQDLGLPFAPTGSGLTRKILDDCRREPKPTTENVLYMGVDVGAVLHVVIREAENSETGERLQVYAGEVTWSELPILVEKFKIQKTALAEKDASDLVQVK